MSEAPNRTGRQITLNYGFVQLLAGGLCSYPLSLAAVGAPALIVMGLTGGSDSDVPLALIVAAGIGAAVYAALGKFLGGRRWATWYAVVGLQAQPLVVVIKGALDPAMRSSNATMVSLPWAVAGVALVLSFWLGRRHRGGIPLGIEPQGLQEDST